MKSLFAALLMVGTLWSTTISVVPVYEPLSLRSTDVDDELTESGEALQATVMARPMALSGAFPEVLVESVRSPHKLPTNDPNYTVEEVNLLVLCHVDLKAEVKDDGLHISIDVGQMAIPEDVDLTSRQLLKLAILAIRQTLEAYQAPQNDPLDVRINIDGTTAENDSLHELDCRFLMEGS